MSSPEHPSNPSGTTLPGDDRTIAPESASQLPQLTQHSDPNLPPTSQFADGHATPASFDNQKEDNPQNAADSHAVDAETGALQPRKRSRWDRLNPLKSSKIPPIPEVPQETREIHARWWSKLTFWWLSPLMSVGYQRPLEANDLWNVPPNSTAAAMSDRLSKNYQARKRTGTDKPLLYALFDTYKRDVVIGGLCSLVGSLIMSLSPFVLRYVVTYVTEAYISARDPRRPKPPVGNGIGTVVAVIALLIIQSICSNQFFYRSGIVGSQARGSLTVLIFEKAMRLSGRARAGTAPTLEPAKPDFAPDSKEEKKWLANQLKKAKREKKNEKKSEKQKKKKQKEGGKKKRGQEEVAGWSNGKIVNLMSTDTHRIELGCGQMHTAWSSPIAVIVTVVLLLVNLTYSALPGLALFFLSVPILGFTIKTMFIRRKAINTVTESRVNLTQEILQAVRFVKVFAWEHSFSDRLNSIRKSEIRAIRRLLMIRNGINAFGMSIPVFAAMISFITFSMSGNALEPGPIFSSLGLFNSLRLPMNLLPLVLGQVVDAIAAVNRIQEFLEAEEGGEGPGVPSDPAIAAVEFQNASFTWEQAPERESASKEESPDSRAKESEQVSSKETVTASKDDLTASVEEPFQLNNLSFTFRPDELVAVVGAVGSGKTSLLAAISGEMRHTGGHVAVSRPKALCPQPAWVENATVRENILFGAPYVPEAYRQVVFACGLEPDFAQLTDGDRTEIGERGITLSGGQRQRIGIARAAYARLVGVVTDGKSEPVQAAVLLLDDPLAAVDAHVGRHIFDHAIAGMLQGSCRVLATHQLWVLPRCDRILWLQDGRVAAFGTLDELRSGHPEFDQLVAQSLDAPSEKAAQPLTVVKRGSKGPEAGSADQTKALMSVEDRAVDGVSLQVYLNMFRHAGSLWIAPGILILLTLSMGTNLVTGLWLAWWSGREFKNLNDSEYAGIYAGLGFIQAFSLFAFAGGVSTAATRASRALLSAAFKHVLHAPVSFFDTTPLGRITNRFAKDVDSLDNNVSDAARMFLLTFGMITSTIVLVIVYFPPFAAALVPAVLIILFATAVFRASARELRRHESVLRSTVFARFSEGVAGVSTVRAYDSQERVCASLRAAVDKVDSASFLSTASQRWLAVRLDFVGTILVIVACILVLVRRETVSPSISGLVLSYTLVIAQMIQFSVRQMAELETTMTAAERVSVYATELPQEPAAELPGVPQSWPSQGGIEFDHVNMRYREGLPLVLKDFSLSVRPGERLALIGRTGAGKSSVLTALFRLVDPASGAIRIDGRDIREVGLHQLRSRLAIIPQDPTLFRGTVRSNLDPFGVHNDDHLWLALRRSGLADPLSSASLHLDDTVDDSGSNFSLGQRQLLALARALVRTEARIVVCDEATSSVDVETDRKVQRTMMSCFGAGADAGSANPDDAAGAPADGSAGGPRTLITIAHRLRTIIGYDRVCVLQAGEIVELATPLDLFDIEDGVFRSMCDRSGITRAQVIAAAADPSSLEFESAGQTPPALD